ncbi:MAG: hypothetical protein ACPGOV_16180 [Magnetovibrionaceae bacterium]
MTTEQEVNRARLEMQQELRKINRETINALVPELNKQTLKPLFELVAKARGLYIKKLLELASGSGTMPTDEQVRELHLLRLSYEELLSGGQMIETAIERGYVDVGGKG